MQPAMAERSARAACSKSPIDISYRRMVSAPYVHHLVRVDDVAQALGHLDDGVADISPYFSSRAFSATPAAVLLQQLVCSSASRLASCGELNRGSCRERYACCRARQLPRHCADVVQELMQNRLYSGDCRWCAPCRRCTSHRRPVLQSLLGAMASLQWGVHVGAGSTRKNQPLGHGVSLAGSGAAAAGAGGLDPVLVAGQRGSPSGPAQSR